MTRLRERQESLKLSGLGLFTKMHKNLCSGNANSGKLNLNLSGAGWSGMNGSERWCKNGLW